MDEESIFEIKYGNAINKIEKISQVAAVDILSEGLMSLQKGLLLFDQISSKPLSVITEGDNILHLEKALKIMSPLILEKIDFIKGAEGGSGKDQLKALFEFFKLVPHTKSVLFIFDCDVNTSSKVEQNNTYIMSLPKNESNTLAIKGIENVYPESMFEGFLIRKLDSRDKESKFFDSSRKKDFLMHVMTSENAADFQNYQTVIEKISSILS